MIFSASCLLSDDDRSPRNYLDGAFGGGDADEPAVVIEPSYPLESGGAAVSERDVRETVVNPLFGVEDASFERSASSCEVRCAVNRIRVMNM